MKQLIFTYTGGDLVIPQEQIEALGISRGDEIAISAIKPDSTNEREEIEGILDELARALPDAQKDSEREIRKVWDKLKPPRD